MTLRTISGHRDTGFTACPGDHVYSRIPSLAGAVAATGLPKLYFPTVRGALGGQIQFHARLSTSLPWTVYVRDATGATVASGSGSGTDVSWTWDSAGVPVKPYAWVIVAPGVRAATGSIGGSTALPLPLLGDVSASPAIITPGGGGTSDFATITYTLGEPALVTASFTDAQGANVVKLFSEQKEAGRQSFRFTADAVPDGRYRITLTALTADGRTASASVWVVVSRVLKSFTLDRGVFSPNGDGVLDRVTFSFDLAASANVRLELRRGTRVVATPAAGDFAAGRHSVRWEGSVPGGRLPDGRYSTVLEVEGGTGAVSVSAPLVSDTRPPRLTLVSVRPPRIRLSEAGFLTVTRHGRRVTVRARAGLFRLPLAGHGALVSVRDDAGNRSRVLRIP